MYAVCLDIKKNGKQRNGSVGSNYGTYGKAANNNTTNPNKNNIKLHNLNNKVLFSHHSNILFFSLSLYLSI